MPIALRQEGEISIMALSGRFDALMAKEFKNRVSDLIDGRQLKIAIDMMAVDFIDSSGMGALVGSLKGVSKENGVMKVTGLSPEVRTIFELTRLHRIFDIYDSLDAACASF